MIKHVDLNSLEVGEYQRPVNESRVRKMQREWDDRMVGVIAVGVRDGRMYIIDGQHRVEAARKAGKTSLLADVIETESKAEEAEIFSRRNDGRNPTAIDKFHADRIAGVRDAVDIAVFLDGLGLYVPRKSGSTPHGVCFMSALRSTWKTHEPSARSALRIMKHIAGDANMDGQIYSGIWYLLASGLPLEKEIKQLAENGTYARALRDIRNGATRNSGGTGNRRFGMVVLDAINYRRKRKFVMPDERRGLVNGKEIPC